MRGLLEQKIEQALTKVQSKNKWSGFDNPKINVERPRNFAHGDWMTNIALVIAKEVGQPPRNIAEELCSELENQKDEFVSKFEVAGPGFINITVTNKYLQNIIEQIVSEGDKYGNNDLCAGQKVNNEFISANPTGPLHLGNGRGGFLGDVIARVLKKTGAEVTNEYYVNDAGEQILTLGHSVLQDEQKVYAGEYIDLLNKKLQDIDIDTSNVRSVGEWAANEITQTYLKKTTADVMHIDFDKWTFEKKDIVDSGYVDRAIDLLKERDLVFEKDGAVWLQTTKFDDDKDRVLIKKDGTRTYFASDCGYILNKIDRGFTKLIEIWGADHHGYIRRFEAAARALGFEGEIKFMMVQLVRLMKDGKEVRMSKRAGNVVYIDELIKEVGHDVTRFMFLMHSCDSHMDFDLTLAKEQSNKNPVFYVQYAFARLASIIKKGEELSLTQGQIISSNTELLINKKEKELMRELEIFTEVLEDVAQNYNVHKLPQYAISLAEKFHSFYGDCRVVDEDNMELTLARLKLVYATKSVIAQTLKTIKVGTPEKM